MKFYQYRCSNVIQSFKEAAKEAGHPAAILDTRYKKFMPKFTAIHN